MSHLLCIGLGYSARPVAADRIAAGWRVTGTTRSEDKARRLVAAGIEPIVFDGTTHVPALARAIAEATHLLVSVAPSTGGDPTLACHAGDIAVAEHLAWIGYLSTVGVYGDHAGGWVDETTPPAPISGRGVARVAAEQAWLALAGEPTPRVQVFRLAGIYGPGRGPFAKLRAGTARRIVKLGQVFNRIHVDDIATTVLAGLCGRGPSGIFNVTDDEPAPPQEVLSHAAALIGIAPPPEVAFEDADLTPMAASFYGESKRVANQRIKRDLGVHLAHPTYREGLAAIASAEAATGR